MSIPEILIVGLALSMDAFAVTITNLLSYPRLSRAGRLALPITFALFQGIMLIIGYFVGNLAVGLIEAYAGPIALVILAVIGGKMILEAIRERRKQKKEAEEKQAQEEAREEEVLEAEGEVLEEGALEKGAQGEKTKAPEKEPASLSLPIILFQGFATSLDALIVGVSLAALYVNILVAAPIVALITFALCLIGLIIGKRVGLLLGNGAQIVGGIILILIGIKVCFF